MGLFLVYKIFFERVFIRKFCLEEFFEVWIGILGSIAMIKLVFVCF